MADEPEELLPEVTTRETVADDVRDAFKQHSEAVAEKLANSTTDETAAAKAERLRDERGQFVAKDKSVEQVAAPATQITDADRREEQAIQPSTANGPPTSWSAGAKTEWSKIPPSIQAEVLKRESDINEGGRQWSEQKRGYEQALGPAQQIADQYQMPVADAVQRLVTVERRLASPEAPQVILELAQAYGVNLAALVNGSQQPQSAASQALDPNRLFQQLDQRLEQRLQEADQKRTQEAETNSIISTFAGEKDQTGQPAHPHFDTVKSLMGHLLNSGQADSMQDAYDKAVWATPATREAMIKVHSSASPMDAERQRTAKARKAAVSINGAPTGGASASNLRQANGNTVADDVRAAWNAAVS